MKKYQFIEDLIIKPSQEFEVTQEIISNKQRCEINDTITLYTETDEIKFKKTE